MGRFVTIVMVLVSAVLIPALAFAQGAITGVVTDSSGAVLPGVTVEVASPVLIERVRSAVSDGTGQYRIVGLGPGTYTITFTLTGFNTYRRGGIEIAGDFTAKIALKDGRGTMADFKYVDGASVLPSDAEVKKLRPAAD